MVYTPHTWVGAPDPANPPAGATKVSTLWLNEMEAGIQAAALRADDAYTLAGSAGAGGGVSTTADFGAVSLDAFTGADDDAKLTAALSALAADTYPRGLLFRNRRYDFFTAGRVPFAGMRLIAPAGQSNPERSGNTKMTCHIHLNFAGAWFAPTSTVYSTYFDSLSFVGGSGAWVIGGTGNWYQLRMKDISSSGLRSVIGSVAQKALLTACQFEGAGWELNNSYDLHFHAGGSDNFFWTDGGLIDSGVPFGGVGQSHLWFDGMDKSNVGGLYITAEADWSAIRVTGNAYNNVSNNQGGPLVFTGLRIEGRNETQAAWGRLVSVEGGIVRFRDCDFNFAMEDPANAALGRTDLGVIQHTGGQLAVLGGTYDRAATVAETVPFVYTNVANAGAKCIVKDIFTSARGGAWSGLPRVAKATAGAENRITDATVTQITV